METAAAELKQMLFEELELIVRTASNLIIRISPEDLDFRPAANMRSLQELAIHLVSVPYVDLLILQENAEPVIREAEQGIEAEGSPEGWVNRMKSGAASLKTYMESLSEEDFLHRTTRPFYLEHGTAQAKWLIEIVTHAQHHRAQLFTYLKIKGYDVSMFDLY